MFFRRIAHELTESPPADPALAIIGACTLAGSSLGGSLSCPGDQTFHRIKVASFKMAREFPLRK